MAECGFKQIGKDKVRIFLISNSIKFELTVPIAEISRPKKRKLINAWIVNTALIPRSGISIPSAESLLDLLDSKFPVKWRRND